jgi:hypothetical protein
VTVPPARLRHYATAMSARAKSRIAGRGAPKGAACQRAGARYRSEGPSLAGARIGPRSNGTWRLEAGAEVCA